MSISAAQIAAVMTQARATFPGAAVSVLHEESGRSLNALRSGRLADDIGDLSGEIEGTRWSFRVILSDCGPRPPIPGDHLREGTGIDQRTWVVLSMAGDQCGATRILNCGEASA